MESSSPPLHWPRGSRADAETSDAIYLIKNVSRLHATYQVRLLAFAARERGKRLILVVPRSCAFAAGLEALVRSSGGTIRREDLP
jgi:hypothetical protein